ncbi:hypothetical protein HPB52_000778 [Rhipicephalus sanguineus]|uniref:DDE Tnp4 domain-containing protein n=1 Tax=Rhipicephalus sanguineus TaxID=34632 RepID=A0A9D4SY57_RHISA|nr:hypothetical protein HPB52_000778 [Rhipicephalus sanguineus]
MGACEISDESLETRPIVHVSDSSYQPASDSSMEMRGVFPRGPVMNQRSDRDQAIVEVGLALVALGSIEDELNAAKARVDSIKDSWAYVRNERWFEDTLPFLGDGHFKRCFRVSPATFRFLVDSLRPSLERVTTNMRESIVVEKVVAIGLFELCSVAEDRVVASVFGIGRSTVNGIYKEFCEAVVSLLESNWINMLSQSDIAEHIREFAAGPLFKNPVATIGGVAVPPLVLCDQAFPLTPNLIKPFGHNDPLRAEQKNFNYHISRVRRVVENAFARLKARFRFTSKRMECDIANASLVIRACCVLNNICEDFSDAVPLQWLQEVQQSDSQLPQPERSSDSQIGNADSVRSALVDYFSQRMQTQPTRS